MKLIEDQPAQKFDDTAGMVMGEASRNKNKEEFYRAAKTIYASWNKTLSHEPTVDLDSVRKQVRHHSVSAASQRLKSSRAVNRSLNVLSILHLALGVIIVTLMSIKFSVPAPKNGIPINPSIIVATVGYIVAVGVSSTALNKNGWPRLTLWVVYLAFAANSIYAGITLLSQPSTLGTDYTSDKLGGVAALTVGISLVGNMIIDTAEFTTLFSGYIKPLSRRYAETVMVSTLIGLLNSLISNRTGISSVKAKVDVCRQIQSAASWLRGEFAKSVATSDPRIDDILEGRFCRSAGYLHEAQLRVVFADEKTVEELREMVAKFITAILRGEYALLPSSDSVPVIERSVIRYIVIAIRAIVVGLIPIGCVFGVRYVGLSLSAEFTNWAVIFAIGWAAITLVSTIDPLYKARLADIRDFIASVRGNGK